MVYSVITCPSHGQGTRFDSGQTHFLINLFTIATQGASINPAMNHLEILAKIKQMRAAHPNAAVDLYGCRAIIANSPPSTRLFEMLIALVLSSQTRDEITSAAMGRLRTDGYFKDATGEKFISTKETDLEDLLYPVGFYRQKTKSIKAICKKLKDEHYEHGIPDTFEGLTALPGVGQKMALLGLSIGFNRVEGIAVDTHVHKVSNRLGLAKATTPEGTRKQLEKLFEREHWGEVNEAMVGFGQTVCLTKPKCEECLLNTYCPYYLHVIKKARKAPLKKKSIEEDEVVSSPKGKKKRV